MKAARAVAVVRVVSTARAVSAARVAPMLVAALLALVVPIVLLIQPSPAWAGGGREIEASTAGPARAAAVPTLPPPVRVTVSVLPQRYFVERVGGERVLVEVLVEPGREPHTYDPTPRQVERMAASHIYFAIGSPFEQQLISRVQRAAPHLRVVDTLDGIELLYGEAHYHFDEQGDAVLHAAEEPDPHVWLGPLEVRRQILTIRDALIEADPDGAELYRAGYAAFDAEIEAMHREFEVLLEPARGRAILTFHPAFAYFANTYGIRQRAIELEGKEPAPRHLERLIDEALREGTRVIFTQPEFSERSAQIIARAIHGRVVSLNPLEPDWPAAMRRIATAIAEGAY